MVGTLLVRHLKPRSQQREVQLCGRSGRFGLGKRRVRDIRALGWGTIALIPRLRRCPCRIGAAAGPPIRGSRSSVSWCTVSMWAW